VLGFIRTFNSNREIRY